MSKGRVVGNRYRLGEVLGHGGMGEVFLAEDLQLRRPVAVKMLHAELLDHRDARRRFEDEARAAARLTHPNVVGVYDIGEHRGAPYLVMERMHGPSLAAVLTRGPLPAERVRRLGLDVLGALSAAHAEGIVHRDIKPSNVLLTSIGDAKLADFGAAKSHRADSHTVVGVVVGTPAYLAPERLAGEPASARSDLYSVGVLFYESLAGRRPFSADSALRALSDANRAELDRWLHGQPTEALLAVIIERALNPDPAARYGSATEMAHALAEAPGERDGAPEFLQLSALLRQPATEDLTHVDREPSDPTLFDRRANPGDRRGSVGDPRRYNDRRGGAIADSSDHEQRLDAARHSAFETDSKPTGHEVMPPALAQPPLLQILRAPAHQDRRRLGIIVGAALVLGLSVIMAKAFDDPPSNPAAPQSAPVASTPVTPTPATTPVSSTNPTGSAVAPVSVPPNATTNPPIPQSLDEALQDLEALVER